MNLALSAHRDQVRKVKGDPYIGHIFAVTGMVMEYGGDTDQVIAALLHDVVEDTDYTLSDVRQRFGDAIAEMVAGLSEQKDIDGYKTRKREYAERLRASVPESVLLVSLADKTHNLESTLRHMDEGYDMLTRFPSVLWYNRLLLEALSERVTGDSQDGAQRLLGRYRRAVEDLEHRLRAAA